MLTKQDIIAEAKRLNFADIGFTTAEPFTSQKEFLLARQEEYGWAEAVGLGLLAGTDPQKYSCRREIDNRCSGIIFRRIFSAADGASFRPVLS